MFKIKFTMTIVVETEKYVQDKIYNKFHVIYLSLAHSLDN